MKTTIFIFISMLIWSMMPIEAMADRGDRHNRRPAVYSEHNDYNRHEGRHDRYQRRHAIKREHRRHRRQSRHQRIEYRYQRPQVEYITSPVYTTYGIPFGSIYTAIPGVSLYFSW